MTKNKLLILGSLFLTNLALADEPAAPSTLNVKADIALMPRSFDASEGKKAELLRLDAFGEGARYKTVELPGTWLDGRRYQLEIPLRVKAGTALSSGDTVLFSPSGKSAAEDAVVPVSVVIRDRDQCMDLIALDAKMTSRRYDLCVTIVDEDLQRLGINVQAFDYRKPWGLAGLAGISWLSQSVPDILSPNSSVGHSKKAAIRAGVSAWWYHWHAEAFLRQSLYTVASENFSPRWIRLVGGYGIELPRVAGFITPHLTLLGGIEFYNNDVPTLNVRFIQSYRAVMTGLRARFAFHSRLDTGGEFFWSFVPNAQKYLIQADVRYWLTPGLALGLGMWADSAKRNSERFSESSLALETYLRFAY